ncbi:MAG: HepT-like ribonuclease domain-containing protein [Actinomycetota bacterium]
MNDRARDALAGMRDNANRALDYASRNPDWMNDDLVTDAISKRVEQVAEIAKYQFPRGMRSDFSQIKWDLISGMREKLAHDYDQLDLDILKDVIDNLLPNLVSQIDLLVAE